jgi:GNAT superfamily N-acetyltransferase
LNSSQQICIAQPENAPAIARLVNAAFVTERFFIEADRTDPDKVSDLFQKGVFLLLFHGDILVGSVYVEVRGERGYFGMLAVDPKCQRNGIGRQLISAAEAHCKAAACRFMDLTFVNVRKELPGYYEALGYVENGTLPLGPEQVARIPVHLVRMSKTL